MNVKVVKQFYSIIKVVGFFLILIIEQSIFMTIATSRGMFEQSQITCIKCVTWICYIYWTKVHIYNCIKVGSMTIIRLC